MRWTSLTKGITLLDLVFGRSPSVIFVGLLDTLPITLVTRAVNRNTKMCRQRTADDPRKKKTFNALGGADDECSK